MIERIFVADHAGAEAVPVGSAYVVRRRGRLSVTFTYDSAYLAFPDARAVDPQLPLSSGAHHTDGLPGAFADAAPDRWGRRLIDKATRASAAAQGIRARACDDLDYLLGVSDLTRQGSLRFATSAGGPYVAQGALVPPVVDLPALLEAARSAARDDGSMAAVKALLDAGTASLGGARPKASVREGEDLAIAKFPHDGDDWDVMAWEHLALTLAELAGIDVPQHHLVRIGERNVLVVRRFDRAARHGGRVPYVSAMTLVGARDGDLRDYLDVGEAIQEVGTVVAADLRELWRRMAFSVGIRNTDDHLRNHGFLGDGQGWRLAPVFDVNPDPHAAAERATAICGAASVEDEVAGLLSAAPSFGLSPSEVHSVLAEVIGALSRWRTEAQRAGIDATQIEQFAPSLDDSGRRLAAALD